MQSRQRLEKLKKKTAAEAASIGISGGSAGMHGSAYDPEGLLMSYWIGEQTVCSVACSVGVLYVAFGLLQPCVYHDVQRLEPR